jgi:hypothetical protein
MHERRELQVSSTTACRKQQEQRCLVHCACIEKREQQKTAPGTGEPNAPALQTHLRGVGQHDDVDAAEEDGAS